MTIKGTAGLAWRCPECRYTTPLRKRQKSDLPTCLAVYYLSEKWMGRHPEHEDKMRIFCTCLNIEEEGTFCHQGRVEMGVRPS